MGWSKYLSGGLLTVNKNKRFKTPKLRSDLCDYSDPYIVKKGTKGLLASAAIKLVYNAEYLNLVMLMHNLLEYNKNYCVKSGSLWNYNREKIDGVCDIASHVKHLSIRQKEQEKHQTNDHDHYDHHSHHKIQMDLNHRDPNDHHN